MLIVILFSHNRGSEDVDDASFLFFVVVEVPKQKVQWNRVFEETFDTTSEQD